MIKEAKQHRTNEGAVYDITYGRIANAEPEPTKPKPESRTRLTGRGKTVVALGAGAVVATVALLFPSSAPDATPKPVEHTVCVPDLAAGSSKYIVKQGEGTDDANLNSGMKVPKHEGNLKDSNCYPAEKTAVESQIKGDFLQPGQTLNLYNQFVEEAKSAK